MSRFPYSKPHGLTGKPGVLPFIPLTLYYTHDGIHILQTGENLTFIRDDSLLLFSSRAETQRRRERISSFSHRLCVSARVTGCVLEKLRTYPSTA